jgi:hypothetical protein
MSSQELASDVGASLESAGVVARLLPVGMPAVASDPPEVAQAPVAMGKASSNSAARARLGRGITMLLWSTFADRVRVAL